MNMVDERGVMDLLTSDVARRLGVTPDAVRNYERRGHLIARRTPAGTRIFSSEDVEKFALERAARMRKGRPPSD